MELEHHLDQFQTWAQKSVQNSTADNYRTTVHAFYKRTNRTQPIPLDADDTHIQEIVDDLSTSVSSNAMKAGLRKYLAWRSFKSTSVEEQRTAQFLRDKTGRIEIVTDSRDIESKVLPASKIGEVCRQAHQQGDEFVTHLRMMYETACRHSGINNLLWKDLWRNQFAGEELGAHQIFISHKRSKGVVDGVVEISDHTLSQLEQIAEERDPEPDDHVFLPDLARSTLYQYAWNHFDQYADNVTTHSFRHSRLTHLGLEMFESEGLEYGEIKERLREYGRHKSSDVTEIYIEIVKRKLRQRSDVMSEYRNVDWS